jgi:hypothetical protein
MLAEDRIQKHLATLEGQDIIVVGRGIVRAVLEKVVEFSSVQNLFLGCGRGGGGAFVQNEVVEGSGCELHVSVVPGN